MAWSGILRFTDGISILENPQPPTVPNPATLAIAGGPDPISHATGYFQNNGFNDGDHIRALGTSGTQGETTVIFMTIAQRIEFDTGATDDAALTAPSTAAGQPSRKAGGASKSSAKKATAKKATAKKASAKKAAKKAAAKSGAGKAPAKRAAKATKAAKTTKKATAKKTAAKKATAKKTAASRPAKATAKRPAKKAPAKSTTRSAGKKGRKR